jgi:hypothetical protein
MFSKVRERINIQGWPALPSFSFTHHILVLVFNFGDLWHSWQPGNFLCSHVFNGFRAVGGALAPHQFSFMSAGG